MVHQLKPMMKISKNQEAKVVTKETTEVLDTSKITEITQMTEDKVNFRGSIKVTETSRGL